MVIKTGSVINQIAYEKANRHKEAGNHIEAFRSYLALARIGHVPSMRMLGSLLTLHDEELKEYGGYIEGIRWYRKAAVCGDESAIKAIDEFQEGPKAVFKPLQIYVYSILFIPLYIAIILTAVAHKLNPLCLVFILTSIGFYIDSFSHYFYLFEASQISARLRKEDIEKQIFLISLGSLTKYVIGMALFIIGFGLAILDASIGNSVSIFNGILQVLVSALIIHMNSMLIVKLKRRDINDSQYRVITSLTIRLGRSWEAYLNTLLLLGNLILFTMCFYRAISMHYI